MTQAEVQDAMNTTATILGTPDLLAEYPLDSGLRYEQPAILDPHNAAAELFGNPTVNDGSIAGTVAVEGTGSPTVVLFDWHTRRAVITAKPDTDGAWSATIPPGDYGIMYLVDGCDPITHGPYTVDEPA